MIQVQLIKNCSFGKRWDVVCVGGNIAHGIIERGEGKIFKPSATYKHRMLNPEEKLVKAKEKTKRTYRKRKK